MLVRMTARKTDDQLPTVAAGTAGQKAGCQRSPNFVT